MRESHMKWRVFFRFLTLLMHSYALILLVTPYLRPTIPSTLLGQTPFAPPLPSNSHEIGLWREGEKNLATFVEKGGEERRQAS